MTTTHSSMAQEGHTAYVTSHWERAAFSSPVQELLTRRRNRIREDLLHHADDYGKRFVSESDVHQLWRKAILKDIFPRWSDGDIVRLLDHYVVSFTILVFIGWPIDRDAFRRIFLSHESHADANLPFARELLAGLEPQYIELFMEKQYIFKPCIIRKSRRARVDRMHVNQPWPFIDVPRKVGCGGYGEVWEATIAKGCYVDENDSMVNNNNKLIAYKQFRDGRDYQQEVQSLDYLRESLIDHKHIAVHLAAIVHGKNDFFIFFELTPLGDLEVLLNGGNEPNAQDTMGPSTPKYDFNKTFSEVRKINFVEQLGHIASALEFLHERLPTTTSLGVYCAHMDLRPKNILIYPMNTSSPNVGKWVLADFGISSFKQGEPGQRSLGVMTMGDFALDTSRTGPNNLQGTHRAPELHEMSIIKKYPGRKCDIWSFGCISNEVLAFLHGGLGDNGVEAATAALNDFRQMKKQGYYDDYWFEFEQEVPKRKRAKARLRSSVAKWLSMVLTEAETSQSEHARWISLFVDILHETLSITPEDRPLASKIVSDLKIVAGAMDEASDAQPWASPGLSAGGHVDSPGFATATSMSRVIDSPLYVDGFKTPSFDRAVDNNMMRQKSSESAITFSSRPGSSAFLQGQIDQLIGGIDMTHMTEQQRDQITQDIAKALQRRHSEQAQSSFLPESQNRLRSTSLSTAGSSSSYHRPQPSGGLNILPEDAPNTSSTHVRPLTPDDISRNQSHVSIGPDLLPEMIISQYNPHIDGALVPDAGPGARAAMTWMPPSTHGTVPDAVLTSSASEGSRPSDQWSFSTGESSGPHSNSMSTASSTKQKWGFQVPKDVRVFEIGPAADKAAFIHGSQPSYQLSVLDLTRRGSDCQALRYVNMPSSIQWDRLSITSRYLVVAGKVGTRRDGCFIDLLEEKQLQRRDGWPWPCEKMTPSSRGVFAWINIRDVCMWNSNTGEELSRTIPQDIDHICFNTTGTCLFIWARNNDTHFIYTINMLSPRAQLDWVSFSATLSRPANKTFIWSAHSQHACLVQEASHLARRYMRSDEDSRVKPQEITEPVQFVESSLAALCDSWMATARRIRKIPWTPRKLHAGKLQVSKRYFKVTDGQFEFTSDEVPLGIEPISIPSNGQTRLAAFEDRGVDRVVVVTLRDNNTGEVHPLDTEPNEKLRQRNGSFLRRD